MSDTETTTETENEEATETTETTETEVEVASRILAKTATTLTITTSTGGTRVISRLRRIKGVTYEQALDKLEMWLKAEDAIATGQSYTVGSRSLNRANLAEVEDLIAKYGDILDMFETAAGSRIRMQVGIYRD